MSNQFDLSDRPDYDPVIQEIADYVLDFDAYSSEALETAYHCLLDSLACGMMALKFPECTKFLGPAVQNTIVPKGSRVPGTAFVLEPEKAAWDIGCLIRWLDFNDTWLAAEWGHPSDNLGAILSVCDFLSQRDRRVQGNDITVNTILQAMIKAHEIQGVLALANSFNRVGLDHVLLVRVASTAVSAWLLGADREQMLSAISHAWVDGCSMRTYRHAPNAGSRKSWAAGDATARGLRLAQIALKGEMGIPSALTARQWGFQDVAFSHLNRDLSLKPAQDRQVQLQRPLGCYVMENILFKISFPAEFHAQTACEAAVQLHDLVSNRLEEIERIEISTHESAVRIISKQGTLANPADRDHCLQYMVAVALIKGDLVAENYEDSFHANHPQIDILREKMVVTENSDFSRDYLDPDKRSIANSLQLFFQDGSSTEKIEIEYPLGHRFRRKEGIPVLMQKCRDSLTPVYGKSAEHLFTFLQDPGQLRELRADKFIEKLVFKSAP